jgi:2-polyprenyl-3-methyl-5-hydroxy-6-metoxy-1,4-benzoquinol methylase
MTYLYDAFKPADFESAKNICITPDSNNRYKFDEETNFLIKFLNDRGLLFTQPRVLDFGCGMGRISRELANVGCNVVGIDSSILMLEVAQGYVNSKKFTPVINTPTFPFQIKPEFDLVISSFVLQHVEDPIKEIEFICSSMKDDATLVLVNEPYRLVPVGMDKDRYVEWNDDKVDIDAEINLRMNLVDRFNYYRRPDKCLSLWKKK